MSRLLSAFLSSAAVLLVMAAEASAQSCTEAPSCAELGFTSAVSDCVGSDMVKCPFDKTKAFCRQTESCAELGYDKTTTQCSGKKTFVCPADASKVSCDDGAMVGEIRLWTGKTVPKGWKICDGSALSASTYSKLYAVIGTSFGGSSSKFNLPDFKGRVAVGAGTSAGENNHSYNYEFGKKKGNNYVVLDATEIPDHQHATWGENTTTTPFGYTGSFNNFGSKGGIDQDNPLFKSGYMLNRYYPRTLAGSTSRTTTSSTTKYDDSRSYSASTGAHDNKMPFSVVYYIIYTGVY